jgi:hypothetical protein
VDKVSREKQVVLFKNVGDLKGKDFGAVVKRIELPGSKPESREPRNPSPSQGARETLQQQVTQAAQRGRWRQSAQGRQ